MSNPVDNVPSNSLLNFGEQTSRVKKTAGKPDKDVDEAHYQTQGSHQRSTGEVVLTESARRMQKIESELHKVPVVDQAKVDSIKERIATDNFQINAENIAEKVLATDKLLG